MSAAEPMLTVEGLNAYYGSAHILHGVGFELGEESVAIVGRNGMGKTTLCATIMGLMPSFKGSARGSVRFLGQEIVGRAPNRIATLGIGYVPQGRRLFPSLTVDEHLRMIAGRTNGGWTPERVYELFPRLAQRRRNGGAQLSGGEQQMLAIGRALLTNPKLLIMDEPSEGLAPAIIENLIEVFRQLEAGGLRILLIEQNLGVATSLAKRQLIMVGGEIATETTADQLAGDSDMQRRYLGVEPLAH
jgi:branched-chain amino acid transport system ATP-binding protein